MVSLCFIVLSASLRRYFELNATVPKYVVIYRDGVGEGQILTVREFEVPQIKESIQAATPE